MRISYANYNSYSSYFAKELYSYHKYYIFNYRFLFLFVYLYDSGEVVEYQSVLHTEESLNLTWNADSAFKQTLITFSVVLEVSLIRVIF